MCAVAFPAIGPSSRQSVHVAPCRGHGKLVPTKAVTMVLRWRCTSRSGVTTVKGSHVRCAWKLWPSYCRTRVRYLLSSHRSRDRPRATRALLQSSEPLPCRNYAPNQVCTLGNTALLKQTHCWDRLDEALPILRASLGTGCCMTLRRSC